MKIDNYWPDLRLPVPGLKPTKKPTDNSMGWDDTNFTENYNYNQRSVELPYALGWVQGQHKQTKQQAMLAAGQVIN